MPLSQVLLCVCTVCECLVMKGMCECVVMKGVCECIKSDSVCHVELLLTMCNVGFRRDLKCEQFSDDG